MDKIEYRAVIKFLVKESLTPNEIHSKLIKVYGTLLLCFQQLKNGLLSLNVAIPSLKMIHVKDVQKVQQHHKSFFFKSRGNYSCRRVFCRSYEEPVQGRDNGAGASLE
jgi:hypothetical protein